MRHPTALGTLPSPYMILPFRDSYSAGLERRLGCSSGSNFVGRGARAPYIFEIQAGLVRQV